MTVLRDAPSRGTTGGGVADFISASICSSRTHFLSLRVYVIASVDVELAGTNDTSSYTALGSVSETIAKNTG